MNRVKQDGPGLVNQDCNHDEHRQEYVGVADGEEARRCLGCGETLLRYIDCGSGG